MRHSNCSSTCVRSLNFLCFRINLLGGFKQDHMNLFLPISVSGFEICASLSRPMKLTRMFWLGYVSIIFVFRNTHFVHRGPYFLSVDGVGKFDSKSFCNQWSKVSRLMFACSVAIG